MTETYVRRLFDQYAGRYDTALTEHLAYRGPAILRERGRGGDARGRTADALCAVLDLGCGTGLGGAAFRPFADRLVGVDLSPAMIAQAAAKGIYDRLVSADIADFLAEETAAATRNISSSSPPTSLSMSTILRRSSPPLRGCSRRMAFLPSPSRLIPAPA